MEILVPKFRRNPNEKVQAIYSGVARGGGTATIVWKPSVDGNRMEATRVYGPAELARGQSGRVAVLVLGGMEATLDEVEDILAAKKAKKFVPQRGQSEIAQMCRVVADRRNELIAEARKRAGMSMAEPATPRKRVRLYLPRGLRYVPTSEPGLKVLARV